MATKQNKVLAQPLSISEWLDSCFPNMNPMLRENVIKYWTSQGKDEKPNCPTCEDSQFIGLNEFTPTVCTKCGTVFAGDSVCDLCGGDCLPLN